MVSLVSCYSVASRRCTEPNPFAITHTYDQGPKAKPPRPTSQILRAPRRWTTRSAAPMLESKKISAAPGQPLTFRVCVFFFSLRKRLMSQRAPASDMMGYLTLSCFVKKNIMPDLFELSLEQYEPHCTTKPSGKTPKHSECV